MASEEMSHEKTEEDIDAYFEKYYPEEVAAGASEGSGNTEMSSTEMTSTEMSSTEMTSTDMTSTDMSSTDKSKDTDTDIADIHDYFAAKYPSEFAHAQY